MPKVLYSSAALLPCVASDGTCPGRFTDAISTADDAEGEDEPSFLPPFANAENRALDAQIRVSSAMLMSVFACGLTAKRLMLISNAASCLPC